jgi:cytochrome c55X
MMRNGWASLFMAATLAFPAAQAEPSGARHLELRHLLLQDCGSCHGMTLKGGLGPTLLPSALEGKPDALLVNTILFGRAGTAMPPWRELLTEADAVWLVEQLRAGVTHE